MIGQVDDGWRCAIAMLMNERVAIGSGGGGARGGAAAASSRYMRAGPRRGRRPTTRVVRQGLADVYIRQRIMGFIGQRTRAAVKAGKAPGPEGSIAKLAGALLARRTSDLAIAIAGAGGQAWEPDDRAVDRWAHAGAVGAGVAHRRRHRRGAAQHHRRAGARAPEGARGRPRPPVQGAQGRHPAHVTPPTVA